MFFYYEVCIKKIKILNLAYHLLLLIKNRKKTNRSVFGIIYLNKQNLLLNEIAKIINRRENFNKE